MYWYVLVHTSTYQYILVRTILPDPVQVYRIPDDGHDRDSDVPAASATRRWRRLGSLQANHVPGPTSLRRMGIAAAERSEAPSLPPVTRSLAGAT